MKDNKVKPNPYRYRVKYDSFEDDSYPYWVEYNGGWCTLWLWLHLTGSESQNLEQAKREIEHHKERIANMPERVKTVYTE